VNSKEENTSDFCPSYGQEFGLWSKTWPLVITSSRPSPCPTHSALHIYKVLDQLSFCGALTMDKSLRLLPPKNHAVFLLIISAAGLTLRA